MEVRRSQERGEAGPRLEKQKHVAAELRLKRAILEGRDYEAKEADLELVRRKHRELSPERVRRDIAEAGGGGYA